MVIVLEKRRVLPALWDVTKSHALMFWNSFKRMGSFTLEHVKQWYKEVRWYEIVLGIALAFYLEPVGHWLLQLVIPSGGNFGYLLMDIGAVFVSAFVLEVGWIFFRRTVILYIGLCLAKGVHALIEGVCGAIEWHRTLVWYGWMLIPISIPLNVIWSVGNVYRRFLFRTSKQTGVGVVKLHQPIMED